MTVFDYFVLGLSYGATALGAVLLFGGAILLLAGVAGTIIHYAEGDDDADE